MVDFNDMAVFVRVVEEGSFIGAGRRLGVPKSTVSRRVAELEARLGVRLLHRTTRALHPTEAGAAYFERCAPLVALAEQAERAVMQDQLAPTGLLRITAPSLLGERILAPIVFAFLARYPAVRVELHLADQRVDLVEEGYDLAIRAGNLPDSELVARRLGAASSCVVASPAYVAAHGVPASLVALRDHQCILVGVGTGPHVWVLADEDGPRSIPVTGPLVVNSVLLAYHAAVAGLGVARLPRFLVEEDIAAGRLLVVVEDRPIPGAGVFALFPGGRAPPTKVRVFLDMLSEYLEGRPWRSLADAMAPGRKEPA